MALYVVVPTLGWSWPTLLPYAVAVAAGYGYQKLTRQDDKGWMRGRLTKELENLRIVSVPIDDLVADVVGEEVGRDERLVFEKEDFRLVFRRDARGKFFVDALGPRTTVRNLLRKEAMNFAQALTQEFVFNRLVTEMEARGLNIIQENVDEETGEIVLEARRWS